MVPESVKPVLRGDIGGGGPLVFCVCGNPVAVDSVPFRSLATGTCGSTRTSPGKIQEDTTGYPSFPGRPWGTTLSSVEDSGSGRGGDPGKTRLPCINFHRSPHPLPPGSCRFHRSRSQVRLGLDRDPWLLWKVS